ncbi:MAG TPA: hypothetical protein VIV09_01010, partial [Pseudolabrys sp.]
FKSQAQRRYLFAKHPEVAREFADATPKGKKLPEKVKHAYVNGGADALAALGLKSASEELRLKIPERTFHGFDAAKKSEAERAHKRAAAPGMPVPQDSDDLEHMLGQIDAPISPNTQLSTRDHLDRTTSWGAPSNLSAGDTAGRLSDMGQNTGFGGV